MRKTLAFLLFFAMTVLFYNCQKKVESIDPGSGSPYSKDSIIVKSNVLVIDSTKYTLVSTADQLGQGIYVFNASGADFTKFIAGNIIVGTTGEGYLRRIVAVTNKTGSSVTLTTSQAALEDVFQQAKFELSNDLSNLRTQGLHVYNGTPYTNQLTNFNLFSKGPFSVTIPTASVSVTPQLFLDVDIEKGSFVSASAAFGGTFSDQLELKIAADASGNFDYGDTVKRLTKRSLYFVGEIPVVVVTDFYLIYNINGSGSTKYSRTYDVSSSYTFECGAKCDSSGQWSPVYDVKENSFNYSAHDTGGVSFAVTHSVIPKVVTRIYGIGGPYLSLAANQYMKGNVSLPSLDWDFLLGENLTPTIGITGSILGHSLGDYSKSWQTDPLAEYITPDNIASFSGNIQRGTSNKRLDSPIVVHVADNLGLKQPYVPVYFTVIAGGGKLDSAKVFTDKDGNAKTYWTLGNIADSQKVSATAKKSDGSNLSGGPVIFTTVNRYKIGDTAFGGIIFYLDPKDTVHQHGLVCSMTDLCNGCAFADLPFPLLYPLSTVGHYSLDSGSVNTDFLISALGSTNNIALTCRNYNGGGFKDWYLPSTNELSKLYIKTDSVMGLSKGIYWSSVGGPCHPDSYYGTGCIGGAFVINFIDGQLAACASNCSYYMRAIRAF